MTFLHFLAVATADAKHYYSMSQFSSLCKAIYYHMGSIRIYGEIYGTLFDANKPQSQCNNGLYT